MLYIYQSKQKEQNTSRCLCYLEYCYLNKLQSQSQKMAEAAAALFVCCGRVNQQIKIPGLKKEKVQYRLTIYTPESFKI